MKRRRLLLFPVLLALCLLPRIGSSTEPASETREAVDNAAVVPIGAEPVPLSVPPVEVPQPEPPLPAIDNAVVIPTGTEPPALSAPPPPSLPPPMVSPAPDNAAIPSPRADPAAPSVPPPSGLPPATTPPAADNAMASPAIPPAVDNAAKIGHTALDRSHRFVERSLFAAADWFDKYTGGLEIEGTEPVKAAVWWKNDFRYDTLQHFTYRSAFRLNVRLPRLANRVHLVIAGENQGDPTAAIPVDPGTPGANVASQVRASSAGLVYDLYRTPRMFFDVGAGLQVKIDTDAYARTRFHYVQPLGSATVARFTATGAYHAREGPGVSNQLDFERRLSPRTTLWWANSVSLAEDTNGWAWGTEPTLVRALAGNRSIYIGGSVRGDSRPSFTVQNYRVYVGYRRSIFRPWLFCELIPDLNWPLQDDGTRPMVWGGTIRLELFFLGREKGKGKEPTSPPPTSPPPTPPPPALPSPR